MAYGQIFWITAINNKKKEPCPVCTSYVTDYSIINPNELQVL